MKTLSIRPPWQDELPRIAENFPAFLLHRAQMLRVLVIPGEPERIVGAVGIAAPSRRGGIATLTCACRQLYFAESAALELLGQAAKLARDAGAGQLTLADSGAENDPRGPWLEAAGFTISRTIEMWLVDDSGEMIPTLERFQTALEKSGRLKGFTADPLTPETLPAVRAMVFAAGLLEPEQVALAGEGNSSGYDPELSTVVLEGEKVVAVLLLRRRGTHAVVEARAVAPEHIGGFNVPNHLSLHRSVRLGFASGLRSVAFAADPVAHADTVRLARRFGGRLASRRPYFLLTLGGLKTGQV